MHLESNITLLYGNETEDDIVFKTEFEEMQKQNENLKVLFTLIKPSASWRGLTGRISADMIESQIADYRERVFYSCGLPEIVNVMVNLLKELRIPEDRIRRETFSGYQTSPNAE